MLHTRLCLRVNKDAHHAPDRGTVRRTTSFIHLTCDPCPPHRLLRGLFGRRPRRLRLGRLRRSFSGCGNDLHRRRPCLARRNDIRLALLRARACVHQPLPCFLQPLLLGGTWGIRACRHARCAGVAWGCEVKVALVQAVVRNEFAKTGTARRATITHTRSSASLSCLASKASSSGTASARSRNVGLIFVFSNLSLLTYRY